MDRFHSAFYSKFIPIPGFQLLQSFTTTYSILFTLNYLSGYPFHQKIKDHLSPHSLCDDGRPVVAAEPHAVRLLALLERDDELVVGLAGLHENMVVIYKTEKVFLIKR